MVISVVTPDLIFKTSVFVDDEILVESFEETFGGIFSRQKGLPLSVVIPELEHSFWVGEGLIFHPGVNMDIVHARRSWSILVDWINLKYHFNFMNRYSQNLEAVVGPHPFNFSLQLLLFETSDLSRTGLVDMILLFLYFFNRSINFLFGFFSYFSNLLMLFFGFDTSHSRMRLLLLWCFLLLFVLVSWFFSSGFLISC